MQMFLKKHLSPCNSSDENFDENLTIKLPIINPKTACNKADKDSDLFQTKSFIKLKKFDSSS